MLSVQYVCCTVILFFRVNSKKRETIVGRVKALLAGDPELKEAAKRAVVAYLRSLHLASNKRLFCVEKLDVAAFAEYIHFLTDYSICTVNKLLVWFSYGICYITRDTTHDLSTSDVQYFIKII